MNVHLRPQTLTNPQAYSILVAFTAVRSFIVTTLENHLTKYFTYVTSKLAGYHECFLRTQTLTNPKAYSISVVFIAIKSVIVPTIENHLTKYFNYVISELGWVP